MEITFTLVENIKKSACLAKKYVQLVLRQQQVTYRNATIRKI